MADEATDVQESNKITLDDFMADEQESPKAESSTAKTEAKAETKAEETKPEVAEKETKPEVQADDTAAKDKEPDSKETETEGEENKDQAAETETDKPQKGAEERKTQLNSEIRDLVAQRNTLKEQVAKANSEAYQVATEQELVDEGMSATDAKVEALRQQIEVRDYNERVADAQLTIESESNRILQDFAWANPNSGEDVYKKELAEEAAALLQQNLILDPNTNQIIGSNISPYQLYKTLDRASGISAMQGQLKGQQDTERMMANADTASNTAPPKQKVDPLVELWKSDD